MISYSPQIYAYRRSSDQDGDVVHHPVVVVGAGPVGLAAAADLALRDIPVVLLDEDHMLSTGSRAICWAKRTLEIFDRLGCGEPVVRKGVGWNTGKVFHRDDLVFQFDLAPEQGHHRPAFVNLQQYHVEVCLVERVSSLPAADIRWMNKVVGVTPQTDRVLLRVDTPDGDYALTCDWLIVADGARSPVRTMLGLEAEGQVFRDRFLIADIRMKSDFPPQRWFWFDPPFHRNQSALLHRQADDVWRVDFQLGWDADPEKEKTPERILPRLRAMLGDAAEFELEWASVYTFQCRRMQFFRHGRVLFAGDAAHLVSPFGARGANSGIQDVDNLVWKLRLVLEGRAPERLLDTYDIERTAAADENIRHSTRATDFITPKSAMSRTFRDAALALAKHYTFARPLINSGRLSVPMVLTDSPLNSPDTDHFDGPLVPGAPAVDAPVTGPGSKWFIDYLRSVFTLVTFGAAVPPETAAMLFRDPVRCRVLQIGADTERSDAVSQVVIGDNAGLLARRYDGRPGTCYLFRPDQHVCARWRSFDVDAVRAAIARATGNA
jgi:3-(3-hydroxy-phenyl)propionate hydroxylase